MTEVSNSDYDDGCVTNILLALIHNRLADIAKALSNNKCKAPKIDTQLGALESIQWHLPDKEVLDRKY